MAVKKRSVKLNRASAYFRLAAKAMYAGKLRDYDRYTRIAERLVRENRQDVEIANRIRRHSHLST